MVAAHDPVGEHGEILGRGAEGAGGRGRLRGEVMGPLPCRFDAENGRERELPTPGVFPDTFAHRCLVAFGVKNVVGDLERQAESAAEVIEQPKLFLRGTHSQATQLERSPEKRPRLATMHPFHPGDLFVWRCFREIADPASLQGKIVNLATDEGLRSSGPGQRKARVPGDVSGHVPREHLEREGLKGVAAQDGGRLVERTMTGGATAPQVVVIHRGQVVMHERIGMNELHGDRAGNRRFPSVGFGDAVAGAGPRSPENQRRAEPLSGGEHGVLERRDEPPRGVIGQLQRLP